MAREGIPLYVIQRQLGHANLGVTSIYLQGINTSEVILNYSDSPAASRAWSSLKKICHSAICPSRTVNR